VEINKAHKAQGKQFAESWGIVSAGGHLAGMVGAMVDGGYVPRSPTVDR